MIGIRADANSKIATGHIMRCMSIATQLVKLGQEVIFIVADLYPQELLEKNGFQYICLNSDWKDKEAELPILKETIIQKQINVVVLDSYEATQEYMQQLKQMTKLVYIDDLYAYEYPVDAIINDALDVKSDAYSYALEQGIQLWVGNAYIMLREEFQNKMIQVHPKVRDVMITTGGADNWKVCQSFLRYIIEKELFKEMTFHVVVGKFFTEVEELHVLQKTRPGIVLHENVVRMSEVMLACDMAISAGGSTLNELSALGIPTICFSAADNQKQGIEEFNKRQLVMSNGDVRDNLYFNQNLQQKIEQMANDYGLRRYMSERAKSLIDGKGAYRLAQNICNL